MTSTLISSNARPGNLCSNYQSVIAVLNLERRRPRRCGPQAHTVPMRPGAPGADSFTQDFGPVPEIE
jgi:hypothetical protein